MYTVSQEDQNFKVILGYVVNSKAAWVSQDPATIQIIHAHINS